jgi:DNA-binding response OmpR family regulator
MTSSGTHRVPLIALVDDEEDILTYLRVALEDHGYRVVAMPDASRALALLERETPDLICLDLLMPEQTGVSLYADLARHAALGKVPIVILSGLAVRDELPSILERAGELPEPAGFLEKPLDIDLFLETVRSLVGRATETVP